MKSSPTTIERGIENIRVHSADAAEALHDAAILATSLSNLHDPADQARVLNALRLALLDAQKAVAEAIYASGQIQLAKGGKVPA